MSRTFHVGVLADTARRYGRAVTRGICAFANEHADWQIEYHACAPEEMPASLRRWQDDGILIQTTNRSVLRKVLDKNCATVSLSVLPEGWVPTGRLVPMLGIDPRAVAEMATSFLLGLGFQKFAFTGYAGQLFSAQLEKAFLQSLARHGISCEVLHLCHDEAPGVDSLECKVMTKRVEEPLTAALQHLPLETAVLACSDYAACRVLRACRDAGLRVPDQLVVMGVENDTVFCEMVRPNLTSIEVEPFGIGYKAAEELDRMLRGGQPMPEPYLSVPQFVVNRASTDILMAADELVQKALRLIRQEVVKGLSAKELVRRLGVSRTKLENRFRSELHQTVHDMIVDRRMAEASRMLLQTAQTQSAIAGQCGFVDNSHFSRLFHKRFGLTPGKYRSRHMRANR